MPFGTGQPMLAKLGWFSKAIADMELRLVYTFQSGRPFTVALLPDIDNSNTGRSNLGFGNNDRPNVTGDPALPVGTAEAWFDTSAFSMPAPGTFGNSGRNAYRGPGYSNLNVALVKPIRFGLTQTVELRLEVFNLFNHPNFDLPDNFAGSPTFGRILSAQSPRHIQFGLKLLF